MRFNILLAGTVVTGCALLGGCMVGPSVRAPKMAMPAHWARSARPRTSTTAPAAISKVTDAPAHLAQWWKNFHDPELTALVEQAARSNLTLQEAAQQIIESREVRDATAATLGPFVNAVGSYQHSRTSRNIGSGGNFGPSESDLYQAGFDATWELDFFGQIRRGVQAANANYRAAIENQRGVWVTLLSELANDYMTLRGVQRQIAVTQANLKTQQHTAMILAQQIGGGLSTSLALANAKAQVATTESQLPELRIQEKQLIYAISILLGKPPQAMEKQLSVPRPIPSVPPVVPIGLPGELLLRRPDVCQAEEQYAAATANVGVQEGNLFPQFTINGNLGYAASDVTKWFNTSSLAYGIGPSVSWPLLNWGQVQSNINQQKAIRIQALLNYRQTVLQALDDVSSALAAYTREQQHEKLLVQAVAENQKAVLYSTQLYENGLTDFLNVLSAQQALYSSQDALVQSQSAVSTDLVALYKALGGGWESPTAASTTTKPAP
ncbi:MAG: efflux transporter outer membrane subunit [Planctomycetia bacterium]|nr:efflux transporter outer membrane subunit [Planctomycetia bacterium]